MCPRNVNVNSNKKLEAFFAKKGCNYLQSATGLMPKVILIMVFFMFIVPILFKITFISKKC